MAGETVSLNCSVTLPGGVSGTPVFQWVGSGNIPPPVNLSTGGQVVTSTLTLSPVRTSQAGQYTCTATLDGCSANSTVAINVQRMKHNNNYYVCLPTIHYLVFFSSVPMPVVTVSRDDNGSELNYGSSLSLICSIQPQEMEYVDTPTAVISSWDVPSSEHDIANPTNTSTLALDIVSLSVSDSGIHSCKGSLADSGGSRYIVESGKMTHTLSITVSKWWNGVK